MHLSFKVHNTADFIFNYLTDMQLFVSVHPVIYKIDHIRENEYKVFEKLMLGPIPYAFTYQAFVSDDHENKNVSITAIVMRFTKIEMQFQIVEKDDYCIVNETITFKSPLPVRGIMKKVFKTQHRKLFENINQL